MPMYMAYARAADQRAHLQERVGASIAGRDVQRWGKTLITRQQIPVVSHLTMMFYVAVDAGTHA